MNKQFEFINCKMTGGSSRILAYQFNRPYDREKNIWYNVGTDFKTTEWVKEHEVNTEEGKLQGSGRGSAEVISFNETIVATITDDSASAFLQECYNVTTKGDAYMQDFLDHGLSVKTIVFANGGMVEKIYHCCTITELGAILEQQSLAEGESALTTQLNLAPVVRTSTFSPKLPASIEEVGAKIDVDNSITGDLTITISNVKDTSNLIVTPTVAANKWKSDIFKVVDGEFDEYVTSVTSDGTTAGVATGLTAGKYKVGTGYASVEDTVTLAVDYRYISIVEVDVI